jgi:hypothetical protein
VLCPQTALVGVVKQKSKTSGEMLDYKIEFAKNIVKTSALDTSSLSSASLRKKCKAAPPKRDKRD